jgi:cell division protein FtsI/penicillin-binding protein 2
MQQAANPQQDILRQRLPFVIGGLVVFSIYVLFRLAYFQYLSPEVISYMDSLRDSNYHRNLRLAAARGLIYDRHGEVLAVNMLDYEIGISPNLVADARETARELAEALGQDYLDVFDAINQSVPWVQLARPVSAEIARQVELLDITGVTIERIPRRSYPQGTLAAHLLGFVNLDLQGHYGVEGYYQQQLAGRVRDEQISNIPFDVPQSGLEEDHGRDIILTLDRDLQFVAEAELQQAITETGAQRGTIIIMNPRNGEILAMANLPAFDPNAYYEIDDPRVLNNPAISEQYEPGSVMKVLTVAAALEQGIVAPASTYYDNGRIDVGGISIFNWDREAHGTVDVTQILVQSLNVGAATLSTSMGPNNFYHMMNEFGVGQPTGVDLEGEIGGTMRVPGSAEWSESQLGTNSFGQGLAVTPLQMLTAVNAIANGGLMMQPNIVREIRDGNEIFQSQPTALGRPISAETARLVTEMMVATVRDGVDRASVAGYSIAGKSGTAEIPSPIGYESSAWIMSFVGFFPADDPQVSIIIKLDRPTSGRWASDVVAPIFQRITERLVILMEIPPDDIRHALAAEGGAFHEINR